MENKNYFEEEFISSIVDIFQNHLYQTLYLNNYEIKRYTTIEKYYREVLPAAYMVRVDYFDGGSLKQVSKHKASSVSIYENNIIITEVSEKIRAYSIDRTEKIDIITENKDIIKRCSALLDECIHLEGEIICKADEFYKDELKKLNIQNYNDTLTIGEIRILNPLNIIEPILKFENSEFATSSIHGDLHLENIMYANGKFAIIDYGMVKDEFLTVHDIIVFASNFIVKVLSAKFTLKEILCLLQNVFFNTDKKIKANYKFKQCNIIPFLRVFNYFEGKINYLQKVCSEKLYYGCYTLYFISMLKFSNLSSKEKQVAVMASAIFAEHFMRIQK